MHQRAAAAGSAAFFLVVLGRLELLLYGALVWAVCAAFVVLHEEPALARRYGPGYEAYRRSVPAWVPRRRAD
jgi:protein-S-isoprenylcysteine O-methyltransferase Ste14